ncbi:WXG100 family type VII secretion target [Corynebacterium kroppenstedtii]|uniref:WXG100 family type VII secretion target n=1 Tax=Corynebacterium sp. PCR 32 TaxID=3351342 RepID=UPI0030B1568C
MSTDMIHYSFGDIAAASGDITQTSGRINGLLDDLKSQLAPMVSTWTGESATAYQAAQQRWDTAAADLNQVLATIARVVAESNDSMSTVNRSAAASWG